MNVTQKILSFFTPEEKQLVEKYNGFLIDGELPYTDPVSDGQYNAPWKLQDFIYQKLRDTFPYVNQRPIRFGSYELEIWIEDSGDLLTKKDKTFAQDCLQLLTGLFHTFYYQMVSNGFLFSTVAHTWTDQTLAFEAEATLWTIIITIVRYLFRRGYPDNNTDLFNCLQSIDEHIINRSDDTQTALDNEDFWRTLRGTPGTIPRLDQLGLQARLFANPEIWGRSHTASLPASTESYTGGRSGGGASSSSSSTRAGAARYLGARRREDIIRRRRSPYSAQWRR